MHRDWRHFLLSLVLILCTSPLLAGPAIQVVVGKDAPELERFAASELAEQCRKLFQAETTIVNELPQSGDVILLGSPATNPVLKSSGLPFPMLSDQGHALKSAKLGDRQALIVGGGSPVATLWAVYELSHQFGMRFALFGDMLPALEPKFRVTGFELVLEPTFKDRTWRTLNDFPIGPESFGLAEHQKLIRQLAKLKYNRLMLSVYPWQPYVDFEFQGVKKQTGVPWFGWKFPVDGDTAGRAVFKGAKFFENPDFVGKNTYQERVAAGITQARGIIQTARSLGMSTAIAISPLEFPKEFAAVLPGSKIQTGLEQLTIGPGPQMQTDNPVLLALAKTQIRAYLTTYPEIDTLYLTLPEFPEWSAQAASAFQALDQRTGLGKLTSLEKLVSEATNRSITASKARGAQAIQGNLVALDFFHRLLSDPTLLELPGGRRARLVLKDIDPALYPYLETILPKEAATLNFVDYTARRVAAQTSILKTVPARKVHSSLILTLADDNVGVLPQTSFTALQALVNEMQSGGWDGFSTRYWIIGDLDFPAFYLSRVSFNPQITPQAALEDLTTTALGAGTFERTMKAFELAEKATNLIDQSDLGFAFPVPNMILKHESIAEPVPEVWATASGLYADAMNEMYRVNTRSREGNREFSLYLARRFEFGMEYLNCASAVRRAGIARQKGDDDKRIEELEKAVESLHGGLNALSAITRGNCDRGVIAVLNAFGYRPLKKELEGE